MKLSIVIVNYNVRYFLSTCLQSVVKATRTLDAEVIVVDNNSIDQSVDMLQKDFPSVRVIANNFNAGFSMANNQAIQISKGEYVLLLNPDTIVEEDCFLKCLEYMDKNKDTGGLGVKMLDGSGNFLPESKRGLPTPSVAFYKIFGLSAFFPRSRIFGRYHLGYLDRDEISEVDVLSGAFMLLRKSVLDKIGGLDETFFMYGEDIDISRRITLAGFKNVYFPKARIIHFKGESTKKSSVNYVLVFYRAMIIFARKHFSQKNARLFSILINLAIYFRAFVALLRRLLDRVYLPLIDLGLLWLLLLLIKEAYENMVLGNSGYFPPEVEILAFPILIMCWIIGQFIFGGYHQPVRFKNLVKGLIGGALLVLILYAMLDESMRFSRVIVAISILSSLIVIPISRRLLSFFGLFKLIRFSIVNSAIVGSVHEIGRVRKVLLESAQKEKNLIYISPWKKSQTIEMSPEIPYQCSLHQVGDAVKVFDLDEIVFCLRDVSASSLMEVMGQNAAVRARNLYLFPEGADYLLRSSSVNSTGEFIQAESNPRLTKWSAAKKRAFEFVFGTFALLLSPFLAPFYRKPFTFVRNMAGVISGRYNLVGFSGDEILKPFVLNATGVESPSHEISKRKIDYVINYGTEKDLEIAFSGLMQLDRSIGEKGGVS